MPFVGHEDQFPFVRRTLSTMNLCYIVSGNDLLHLNDTTVAQYQASDLAAANSATVHESDRHVFIRDAMIVSKAAEAAGILTPAVSGQGSITNMNTQALAQAELTAQDASLKPGYTAGIGD